MTKTLITALIGAAVALGGCSSSHRESGTESDTPTSVTTPKSQLTESAFASCDGFRDYYAESLAQEFLTGFTYYRTCWGCEELAVATDDTATGEFDSSDAAPAASPEGGSNRDVSDTNTQEAGVDEADLIETDPDRNLLFVLRQGYYGQGQDQLFVVDISDPANLRFVGQPYALSNDRQTRGMYLDRENDRLVLIREPALFYAFAEGAPAVSDAARSGEADASFAPYPYEFAEGTEVQFLDVSDAANPRLLETYVNDGYLVDSRRIGDRLHLVTQFGFPFPSALQSDDFYRLAYEDYPDALKRGDDAEIQRLEAQIKDRIRAAVAATAIDELLPEESFGNSGSQTLACEQIRRPAVTERLGLLMITSIDTDGAPASKTILGTINNAWQLYASTDSLYLMQTSNGWWFDEQQTQQTAIYRYDIGSGSAEPVAVGLVDGWVNNSYSLGEFDGHLRVATTQGQFVSRQERFRQTNHLTVLSTGDMSITGEVRDFIEDERIFSARFLGDKGFVVTFRQVDPLFAFDLSDPTNPQLAGAVEIPGFSTYIHPLGEDHLLTIGRAGGADGTGTGNGFQLQVFDVSDLTAPAQVATASPDLNADEYAYSLAEYDPHAFTFLDSQGLLAIPAQISSPDPDRALSGFLVYDVDATAGSESIAEYERIDHKDPDDGRGSGCPGERAPDDRPCSSFAPVIYNEPLRAAIQAGGDLGDRVNLLTVSSAKIRSLLRSRNDPIAPLPDPFRAQNELRFDSGDN